MFGSAIFGGNYFAQGYALPVTTAQALSATETQTPTVAKIAAHLQALSATETQTPTIAKLLAFLRTLAATETQTPSVATVAAHLQELLATHTQTPSLSAFLANLEELLADETQTPTIATVVAYLRDLSADETQTPSIEQVVAHVLELAADEIQIPDLDAQPTGAQTFTQDLDATQTQEATLAGLVTRQPSGGGFFPSQSKPVRHPENYRVLVEISQLQTPSLEVMLVPVDLPLLEDDELAVLLLA